MSPQSYDHVSTVVLVAWIYGGVAPLEAKLFDKEPFLSLPLRLSSPWWWITSLVAIVLTVVLLAVIEKAKKQAHPAE